MYFASPNFCASAPLVSTIILVRVDAASVEAAADAVLRDVHESVIGGQRDQHVLDSDAPVEIFEEIHELLLIAFE